MSLESQSGAVDLEIASDISLSESCQRRPEGASRQNPPAFRENAWIKVQFIFTYFFLIRQAPTNSEIAVSVKSFGAKRPITVGTIPEFISHLLQDRNGSPGTSRPFPKRE